MPITNNDFRGYGSPLAGIASALRSVGEFYGIKEAAAKGVLLQQQAEQQRALQAQASDPGSQLSQLAQAEQTGAIEGAIRKGYIDRASGNDLIDKIQGPRTVPYAPGQGPNGPTGMSQAMIAAALPEGGALQKFISGQQSADAMTNRMTLLAAPKWANLEESKNQHAGSAGSAFEQDPIIKTNKGLINIIDRGLGMANGNTPISGKTFNALQQDFINALSNGGAATEGKVSREMMEPIQGDLANLAGRADQIKDMRTEAPNTFNNIVSHMKNLRTEFSNMIADQAENVADNYSENTNPKVQATVAQKLQTYRAYRGGAPVGTGSPQASTQQSTGPHGNTVYQGGHMYTWNPKSKQYE